MNLTLVTAPTLRPVTLEEVKDHLRIDDTDGDSALSFLLDSAIAQVERDKGVKLITQTWDYKIDSFPSTEIRLPLMPLQSVTSVTYTDTDGDSQTWDSGEYTVHTGTMPGKITLAYNESWPTIRDIDFAVTVRFICGYTSVANVPDNLRHAILLVVGTGDKFRENMVMASRGQEPMSLKGQGSYDALIGMQWKWWA